MPDTTYTDEQVREILRRAIERQHEASDGLSQADLIDAAAELGIDAEQVRKASLDVLSQREVDVAIEKRRRRRWRGFWRGFATYAAVNTFLVVMDVLDGEMGWSAYPLLGWGLFVAMHLINTVFKQDDPREVAQALARHRARQERKARQKAEWEAKQLRKAERRARGKDAFDAVVDAGVNALLEAAGRQLGSRRPSTDTEFGRYVDRESGSRAPESQENYRVRVDPNAEGQDPKEADDYEVVSEPRGHRRRR